MAKFSTDNLASYVLDLEELKNIPDSVLDEMLNASADVVEKAQKETALQMLSGKRSTGKMSRSISRKKSPRTKKGVSLYIYPQGSRKRGKKETREAEIAFHNEFGKRNQPARPFIRVANEKSADEASKAAENVFEKYKKSLNL